MSKTNQINMARVFSNLKGFDKGNFFATNGNQMVQSMHMQNEYLTTGEVFKAHICRIVLMLVLFTYKHVSKISLLISDYFHVLILCFHVEWQQNHWFMILFFLGKVITRFWYLQIARISIKNLAILPQRKPNSLGCILQVNLFSSQSPPNIPQASIKDNQNIVVPSKSLVQKAIVETSEYFTKQKIHFAAEEIKVLNELANFVHWCCLADIHYITFYEYSGILWNDSLSLEKIQNAIWVEIYGGQLVQEPINFIILDSYSGNKIQFILNDDVKKQEKSIIINLTDKRLFEMPLNDNVQQSIDKLTVMPDLIVKFDLCAPLYRTNGFKAIAGEQNESLIFVNKKFSLRSFVKALHYYMGKTSKSATLNESSSNSLPSVASSNQSLWNRLLKLRIFDLNSSTMSNLELGKEVTDK